MRTTINLPDALAEQARQRAARDGRTFTSLVEEGLRAVLRAPDSTSMALPPLPTSRHAMGPPLIDITDKDALWDLFDEEDGWS